jgi:hypothetical protein
VVGTDAPTDEPAAGDHLYALPSIRQRIADNLALLLTALATFVFSTVLAPLQRLGNGGWWPPPASRSPPSSPSWRCYGVGRRPAVCNGLQVG